MNDALAIPSEDEAAGRLGLRAVVGGLLRFMRRKPLGAFGALFILMMLVGAIFADRQVVTFFQDSDPLLAPYYFDDQDITSAGRLQSPSLTHPFGTDRLGRDQLSQIIYGARVSVVVGLASVIAGAL
jgi:ABC-type dipeptide/oligopeptide/nickel transport system permease subunit